MNTFADQVIAVMTARAVDREQEGSPAGPVYRRVADDVKTMWERWNAEPITLAEAVAVSGYTERGLRAWMVRVGVTQLTRATVPRHGGDATGHHAGATQQQAGATRSAALVLEAFRNT